MTMARKRNAGEGSIFERSDGRWSAQLNLGRESGKRRRRYIYGATAAEVQDALLKARADFRQGFASTGDSQPLKRFLESWLDSVRATVRPRTLDAYRAAVRKHLIPALGHIKLGKLTPQHVQEFQSAKLKAGLHPRTAGALRTVLVQALNQAVRWNVISRNSAALVRSPKAPRPVIKPLAPEQARQLLAAMKGEPLEALHQVVLTLGLRRGEALGLQWNDIDFDRAALAIRRTIGRATSGIVIQEPKTASGRRTLKLPQGLVAALKAHRKCQLEQRLLAGPDWQDTGYVFTTSIGTHLDPSAPGADLDRLLVKAELEHARYHDLRHSAATFMLVQGVHPKVVADMLGHAKVGLTLDIYSHVLPSLQAEAAGKVEALLASEGHAKAGGF
jgi:integrase